jgi:hypothetical protein
LALHLSDQHHHGLFGESGLVLSTGCSFFTAAATATGCTDDSSYGFSNASEGFTDSAATAATAASFTCTTCSRAATCGLRTSSATASALTGTTWTSGLVRLSTGQ